MNEFLENKGSDLNASNKANATNNLSMRNISGDSPLFELEIGRASCRERV